ncbi:unnamed protein product [Angiostrongylus costaricensis]|uniref:PDZ domain-containing protein n=1 Tax=Angiostrongylus costaricensis TaxID=334426 RepID=A0A0R3PTR2_ANGCS|nr:unnamed protein product [Angiostrongylus costaricensis]
MCFPFLSFRIGCKMIVWFHNANQLLMLLPKKKTHELRIYHNHSVHLNPMLAAAPPFRIEARLQSLVDRSRRQHVQPDNGKWPINQYDPLNGFYQSIGNSHDSHDNKRAYESEYQEWLRSQQHDDGQRPVLIPGQPVPVFQTRRNCLPRQPQSAGQRNNCRQRTPTQPPLIRVSKRICRPAMPSVSPTPQFQRRSNCIQQRHTPTYPPLTGKCKVVYNIIPQTQRVTCRPPLTSTKPVYNNGCIPQLVPRDEDPGSRSKEFRAGSDYTAAITSSTPTNFRDCEGSVKIVSVNAAGVVEHYMYRTGKDVGEVLGEMLDAEVVLLMKCNMMLGCSLMSAFVHLHFVGHSIGRCTPCSPNTGD